MRQASKAIREAAEIYHPSFPGVHVCGADPTETFPITVADFPLRTDAEARRLWGLCRDECANADGEPYDLVVDLNFGEHDECVADFPMSRQMLDRLRAVIERGTSALNDARR